MSTCVLCGADLGTASSCPRCGEPVGTVHASMPPPAASAEARPAPPHAQSPRSAKTPQLPQTSATAVEGPPTAQGTPPTRPNRRPIVVLGALILASILGVGVLVVNRGSGETDEASEAARVAPDLEGSEGEVPSPNPATTEMSSTGLEAATTDEPMPVELDASTLVARASSELPPLPSRGLTYSASNLLDGDQTTAWSQAGSEGGQDPVGSWVAFDLPQRTDVTGVAIVNGYVKSDKAYTENARARGIVISTDDGQQVRATLADIRTRQEVPVDLLGASTVTIAIESVYPGSKYSDVAMTEVRLVGLAAD